MLYLYYLLLHNASCVDIFEYFLQLELFVFTGQKENPFACQFTYNDYIFSHLSPAYSVRKSIIA